MHTPSTNEDPILPNAPTYWWEIPQPFLILVGMAVVVSFIATEVLLRVDQELSITLWSRFVTVITSFILLRESGQVVLAVARSEKVPTRSLFIFLIGVIFLAMRSTSGEAFDLGVVIKWLIAVVSPLGAIAILIIDMVIRSLVKMSAFWQSVWLAVKTVTLVLITVLVLLLLPFSPPAELLIAWIAAGYILTI